MKHSLFLLMTALMLFNGSVFSQTSNERIHAVRTQINSLLATYTGGPYQRVGDVIDVDSSIGSRKVANGNIQDPYGTLKRCYLFIVRTKGENGQFMIGVFRDGQIIWTSGPLPGSENYDYLGGKILTAQELNRGGKVDIVAYFNESGPQLASGDVWVYSWDGSKGECINQREHNGSTSLSSSCSFEIDDIDGDGISEILACGSGGTMNVVYSWNGSLYGEWPNSPNLVGRTYTPANIFSATVSADVVHVDSKLKYLYKISNSATSKQKIQWVSILEPNYSLDTVLNPVGWRGGFWKTRHLVSSHAINEASQLAPNSNSAGFGFISEGLPVITKFYLQAPHTELVRSSRSTDELDQSIYQDILNNSFTGSAISAGMPPDPFVPFDFLDTLVSYKHQALTLSWIDNQGVANSLDQKLENAKSQLQSGNTTAAKNILKAFINDVEAQQNKHLTSEAYALLKFNTEYLISKLQ